MNAIAKKYAFAVLAAIAFTANATPKKSPDYGTNVADTSRIFDIDEIVVVAQPKEVFNLRMQPSGSSSFSYADMKSLGMRDLHSISAHTPAFAMPDYGARLTSAAYIRGTGSRINNPAVGIYFDGIPIVNKNAYNFYTYGLDRVDVLRGPQGTLYGQNTEGGMVRLYTQNPFNRRGTDIHLGLGTHFQRNAEVISHARIGSKFAFTVAGFYNGWNGFQRNVTTNERADKLNEFGGRIRLAFKPNSSFTADMTADYQYVRQNAFAYGLLDVAANTVSEPNTNLQGNYRRNMLNTGLTVRHVKGNVELSSTTSYQYLKDYMLMDQDYTPQDYMRLSQRQFQNALTEEIAVKSRANKRWQRTTGVFASYQWLKTTAPVDFGEATTMPVANGIRTAMYTSLLSAMTQKMVANGMPESAAATAASTAIERAGGVSLDVTMAVPGLFHTPQFNAAVFHESNIMLADRLTATVGLRYDYNRVSIGYDTKAYMSMAASVMGTSATYTLSSALLHSEHTAYRQLLPKVALTLRTDDSNSNVYAAVSKGYRAGGYNIQMFSDILRTELNANSSAAMSGSYDIPHTDEDYSNIKSTIAYKPEVSWNYEAGMRQNLFENTLHLDMAVYYMSIRNQQLSVMAGNYGYGRMMVNAGRSRSIGVEASIRGAAFANRLSWSVSYAYTDSEFTSYHDTEGSGAEAQDIDYKGKKVPYVPANTLGMFAAYRVDFANSALKAITFGAGATAQGKTYWNEANTYAQPFYILLDANINGDLGFASIMLWCRNITNTQYNTFAINSAATGTEAFFAQRGRPIHCGVNISLHI